MNTQTKNFLLEIGTEELPAKNLAALSQALANNIQQGLKKADVAFGETEIFATPRRLAVLIHDVTIKQKSQLIERKGPAVAAAFDASGKPTPACEGFARSVGVAVEKLKRQKTDKGEILFYSLQQAGQLTKKLLPEILTDAVAKLPIPRPMRWGAKKAQFIRPVHWAVMLFGTDVIKAEILGVVSGRTTYGHRFLAPKAITIKEPHEYLKKLTAAKVIPNFTERQENIRQQLKNIAKHKGDVVIDENLLHEVTGLVEWPVALLADFEKNFLEVPQEALISSMKHHQKCFPVVDKNNNLLPHFITISNIESKEPKRVIAGNERVMRARLSDASFFYHSDLKHSLESRLDKLKSVVFQAKLGSLFDKSVRIAELANYIGNNIDADASIAERAAVLAKTDLLSEMVGEFPELQGTMGYYYAKQDNLDKNIALAIKEQYLPRFAGDELPKTKEGAAVAIADRADTLIGIFGINQAPTGEKDPYGLRRAALGLLRIIIEKQLPLDLKEVLQKAADLYQVKLPNDKVVGEAFNFVMERLRAWYAEQNISGDVFNAVMIRQPTQPLDFHHRLLAVQHFCKLPEAQSLTAGNKRVSNILKKEDQVSIHSKIDPSLLVEKEEHALADIMIQKSKHVEQLCQRGEYDKALIDLATLQKPIDAFFDKVLVMADDPKIRLNRLALLSNLRNLFLLIADISVLQL